MPDTSDRLSPTACKPFLKWAGGKRQLLPELLKQVPAQYRRYYEPFAGAGALLFSLQPEAAVLNDSNAELMNCYGVLRHDLDKLIQLLQHHRIHHDPAYYYEVRAWDREPRSYAHRAAVTRAARLIYLNKTCYNGLYRVNSKGQFNVPFGRYKNPSILDETALRAAHAYLCRADLDLRNGDFAAAVADAGEGDFVYFDPPYDPVSSTASFTTYAANGFGRADQARLREVFGELAARGCNVLLSNADTDFIRQLYQGFHLRRVSATRCINSKAAGRGVVGEVLLSNFA